MKPAGAYIAGLLGILSITPSAKADIELSFSTGRDYLQVSPWVAEFRGGDLYVQLRDGLIIIAGCAGTPSPEIIFPNLFCPLGTTGFIAAGDVDGDGIRDDLSFWSISDVVPALLIEPFLPSLCRLASAPPSKLPRPLGPFIDQGLVTFYNVFTENVLQYDYTAYEFALDYPAGQAGRSLMEEQIVYGQYIFTFPLLNNPDTPVALSVAYTPLPEAVDITSRYPDGGFKYTSGTWDDNGNYLMDPRVTNYVTWQGNDPTNTKLSIDTFHLSILDETETEVLFPPSQTPLLLPNPYTQEYYLPPFFFDVGDLAVFRLTFQRDLGTTIVSADTSVRLFNFNLRFVDAYQGFRIVTFPVGSPLATTAANRDFDDDGATNLDEFGMQSDPTDALSLPVYPVAVEEADGRVSFTLAKRENGAVRYQFLVAAGGSDFERVDSNSEFWDIVVDDELELKIMSKAVADPDVFTSNVKVTEIPLR